MWAPIDSKGIQVLTTVYDYLRNTVQYKYWFFCGHILLMLLLVYSEHTQKKLLYSHFSILWVSWWRWKSHACEQRWFLNVMMLVAIVCVSLDQERGGASYKIRRTYLSTPITPGSSINDSGNSIGYPSHSFTKALNKCPCATSTISAGPGSPCI